MKKIILLFILGGLIGAGVLRLVQYVNYDIPAPVAMLPDGAEYDGDMVDGIIEGHGRMVWPGGNRYKGSFKDGLFHGRGRYEAREGWIYEGEFDQGEITGTGTMIFTTEDQYTGEFRHGKPHGEGVMYSDGNVYAGDFKDGVYHGEGTFIDANGDRYTGTFKQGRLTGSGKYIGEDGTHYKGEFENDMYHGKGVLTTAAGDRFEGHFNYGEYHGKGTLTYAEAVDGVKEVMGTWEYGKLVDAEDKSLITDPEALAEQALYNQNDLLRRHWQRLRENDPDKVDMYFLGIAGDGKESVFRREVLYARELFDETFETSGRSMVLVNDRKTDGELPLATTTSIRRTLEEIAERMDVENDILFIYMTSHGSSEFEFSLEQTGLSLPDISAETLAALLDDLPVRWKVVAISACYSGGFIPELKDDHTLIITAASRNRPSFGCTDTAEFTYFGEAFIKDALPVSESFTAAFDKAKELVKEREEEEGFKGSNPQIHRPDAILQQLRHWRQGLAE